MTTLQDHEFQDVMTLDGEGRAVVAVAYPTQAQISIVVDESDGTIQLSTTTSCFSAHAFVTARAARAIASRLLAIAESSEQKAEERENAKRQRELGVDIPF